MGAEETLTFRIGKRRYFARKLGMTVKIRSRRDVDDVKQLPYDFPVILT
jgi:hypothetical protein